MLWSPNEVLAYLKDEVNLQSNDAAEGATKKNSKTAPFGGFPTWFPLEQDFVFIAENSEIYGPNPLFAIPCQSKEIDLNLLSTRILSADYLGLSNQKVVSLKHAQLLMPDISRDIHAAINYFLLFDNEARGFVRPTCIAYITSDKYKLVCFADSIFKVLSEASKILQHCNMLHTIEDLKATFQEIKKHNVESNANKKEIQDTGADDATKEIQDILNVIEGYEGNDLIDKQIFNIFENIKKIGMFSEVNKQIYNLCLSSEQILESKNKNKHQEKCMKNLYSICGNGIILGLYHLYKMYKHFRRKYENLFMVKQFGNSSKTEKTLHFGACVKGSDVDSSNSTLKECILSTKRILKVPSLDNEHYFLSLDSTFEKILLDFLNGKTHSLHESGLTSSFYQSSNSSDISAEPESAHSSSSSGYLSSGSEEANRFHSIPCGHIVPFECIWDILEDLQRENPGIESAFLEILKLFDDTEKLLFSVLTRTPIVLISTPEECLTAQNFVKALSVFIPRRKDEILLIDLNRQEPLGHEYFKYIAAVNVCVHPDKAVEEMIPNHLWHSSCILNLRDCSLTAPAYTGVLLTNVNERFRILPLEGPAFPIIVGILCEVLSTLEWWCMVSLPKIDASAATSSILSKGFSRLDVQILLKLSQLCKS